MIYDGIVLAGGRSSRLGGVAKGDLLVQGRTLVQRTVDALAGARRVVVVGGTAPAGTLSARESPAFGGPAAAIAAGLAALDGDAYVIVLACDMPRAESVVEALLRSEPAAGALLVDVDGREQYLAALYRADALRASVARFPQGLDGVSVRALVESLDLVRVAADDATADIDTWADAAAFGISRPTTEGAP